MPDPILLNPDNRLLGSATGDLSHYGGTADPSFAVRPAQPDSLSALDNGAHPLATGGASPFAAAAPYALAGEVPDDAVPADTGSGSSVTPFPLASFQPIAPGAPVPTGGDLSTVTAATTAGPTSFLPGAGAPTPSAQPVPTATPAGLDGTVPSHAQAIGAAANATTLDQLAGDMAQTPLTSGPVAGIVAPVLAGIDGVVTPVAEGVTGAVSTVLDAAGDAALPLVDAALDGVSATVAAAGTATGALVESTLDGVSDTVGALDAAAVPLLDGTIDGVAATLSTAGSLAGPMGAVLGGVGDAVQATGDVAMPLAAGAIDGVSTTLDAVGDAAVPVIGSVTEGVGTTLEAVGDAAAPVIEAVVGGVGDTVDAVGDTLAGLGGSDPEGGVATLVSLVSVSDMFDFAPVDAATPEPAADSSFGVLDTLAGDLLDPLLGGDQGDAGLFDHGDSHHPLGL